MTALPPLKVDEFPSFFAAVHGVSPFPWQERLARRVAETGWPRVLDLPTGSGKTAALDVAVFTLALGADLRPRAVPLRMVYVVDRRTIVDQAHERAIRIGNSLRAAGDDITGRVALRLAALTGGSDPLHIAHLRGGVARDDDWARRPDLPLIAVSTVDQVGSRLLFRGYGVTDRMKPVHAGLLGSDVLYLLDEVHLSQPFRETLAAIGDRYRAWAERPLPSPFVVVEMSATPGDVAPAAFHLEDDDWQHPELSRRLRTSKPTTLVTAPPRQFASEIATRAQALLDRPGATIAVVVNRVSSARDLHGRLRSSGDVEPANVYLLTGRMRPFDRDALERQLLPRIRAGRDRRTDDPPVVVVATQSIEAGADFDFDDLVTECASLDALRQRFGRLDRMGRLDGASRAAIVARNDSLKDDPVYGDAIGATVGWLRLMPAIDFGTAALSIPPGAASAGLLAPKSHAPVLLPGHLDLLVQTNPIPTPDADVSLWLHGPNRGVPDVHVIWRADITEELLILASDGDANAEDLILEMIDVLPPVSAEAMPVPFRSARRWLAGLAEAESYDVEGAVDTDSDDERSDLERVRPARAAVLWLGDDSRIVRAEDLRPGQTIVVPSTYGGVAHWNWAPESSEEVTDVAELAALAYRNRVTVRLHPIVVPRLFGAAVQLPKQESLEADGRSDVDVVEEWLEQFAPHSPDERVGRLVSALKHRIGRPRVERVRLTAADSAEYFVVSVRHRAAPRVQDVDDRVASDSERSSFTGTQITLKTHSDAVGRLAASYAQALGFSSELVADFELCGQWHDGGKADLRFQRWLHGGSEFKALVQPEPLAKSTVRVASSLAVARARERAGYPQGGRHELTSVALMASAHPDMRAHDWPLVLHLVASHHGFCRPFAPWIADESPVQVAFAHDGADAAVSSADQLARLDSGIAERFWLLVRTYGWWGLAWLEAVFRLADQRQSDLESNGRSFP